jgi:hypothetical protein
MRPRCTWVFASARSFNRIHSVRRASLSLRSELHPLQVRALPLRRVSKVGFSQSQTVRTHSGGRPPAASRGRNWSLQADIHPVWLCRIPPEGNEYTVAEFRLKFSRSSPVPSPSNLRPSGLGFHPHPPIAGTVLCLLVPRSTNSASPLFSQVK